MALAQSPAARAADAYPVKPVRLIVPYAPGGGVDIMARLLAPRLAAALGQSFVVDNRGGGGAIIGSELVARAQRDGYTLLFGNTAHVSNPSLNAKLPYDSLRDFAAVGLAGLTSSVLTVNPATPVRSVPELVTMAKAKPGQLNYASAGVGSAIFLAMELFKSTAGVNITHIAYKGAGPAMTDVIGGQVPVMFAGITASLQHIKAGRLRPLGTSSARGLSVLPEVRPIADVYPGYDHSDWYCLLAPAGTPRPVIERLNGALNQALASPAVRERILAMGAQPAGSTPQEFAARLQNETLKWQKVFAGRPKS
jgi:tripartite-type tricarboxylate transporter receptor subunit TctC